MVAATGVHLVVFPQRVDEEGLHGILLVDADRIDGVHQVGVVKHDLRRLLGEVLTCRVDEVQQTGIGEVLDIVHHRGATGLYVLSELAHVRRLTGTTLGNLVEELLDLREILELYLLDEQDVNLCHHVHGLQQVLAVVAVLLEEGVEAVVDVVLKVAGGGYLRQYLLDDALVVAEDLLKRVGAEGVARQEVDEFTEGEAAQVIGLDDAVELGFSSFSRMTLEPVNTIFRLG